MARHRDRRFRAQSDQAIFINLRQHSAGLHIAPARVFPTSTSAVDAQTVTRRIGFQPARLTVFLLMR